VAAAVLSGKSPADGQTDCTATSDTSWPRAVSRCTAVRDGQVQDVAVTVSGTVDVLMKAVLYSLRYKTRNYLC